MQVRFQSAFDALSDSLKYALIPHFVERDFPGWFNANDIETIKQQTELNDDELSAALLPLAACYAITPISHFNVGAVVRGISGKWYFGANIEFSNTPLQQSIHAEQCAINHAWLRGETALTDITVNYSPCGHCRQFMNELNSGTKLNVLLPNRPSLPLAHYLPEAFGPIDLGITDLLLDSVHHGYQYNSEDSLVLAALDAANRSHAPYSQGHSGVAIEMHSGAIYAGRYAENAAYNPTLPPLQSAIIFINMNGESISDIKRAVLVEKANPNVSQWAATQNTLQAIGCQDVQYITL